MTKKNKSLNTTTDGLNETDILNKVKEEIFSIYPTK